MLHQDNGDLSGLLDIQDESGHILLLFHIHAGHGFVHDQDFWFHGHGPAQINQLPKAITQGPHHGIPDGLHLQEVNDLLGHSPVLSLLPIGPKPVESALKEVGLHVDMSSGHDIVQCGHAQKKLNSLEGPTDAKGGTLVGGHIGDIPSFKLDLS